MIVLPRADEYHLHIITFVKAEFESYIKGA